MSLKNIKSNTQTQQGFTIVELLIVVVVIAILAAITIVSYNGITNRANASAAAATAASLQKKAELFASDGPTGSYPAKLTDLTGSTIQNTTSSVATASNSYYLTPGTINPTSSPAVPPDASNGKNTVQYTPCGVGGSGSAAALTTVNGAKIVWWDFSKSTGQATTINIGNVSTGCATAA